MLVKKKRRYMVLFTNVNGRNCFFFCFCWYRQEKNILDNWYRNWKNPCMNISRVLPLNVDIDRDILISTNFNMYWYFIVRLNFCRCQYRLQNCFLSVKFDIIAGVTRYPAFCGYWQQLPRYRHRNQSRMRQSR